MKYDISYMTTEAVSLLKSLISIPSISREPKLRIFCKTILKWQVCRPGAREIMCGASVRCSI